MFKLRKKVNTWGLYFKKYFPHHSFLSHKQKKGFGTLEIVIIIAVLLAIALIFRKTLTDYAKNIINKVFDQSIINNLGKYELT